VLAADRGPISFCDMQHRQAAPVEFFPAVHAGRLPRWGTPAVVSDDELLVSDGRGRLFLLGISDQDGSVDVRNMTTVDPPLVSSLGATESVGWAVDASNRVCRIALPELAVESLFTLDAPVQWGPTQLGTHALLATAAGEVHCLAAASDRGWRLPLNLAGVVGGCVIDSNSVALASPCGRITIIDTADGRQLAEINVGQPLAFGPVMIRERLSVLTADSCLLIANDTTKELLANGSADEVSP
jgi:hypothetical protein